MIEIAVLGKLQIRWEGEEITAVLPQKGQALLAYLVVTRQHVTRSALAGLLWGEMPEEVARANLRLTLSRLRKVVGEAIIATRSTVAFDFVQPHWLDYALFTEAASLPADQLPQTITLYRGEFLDDLLVADAPDFEAWVLAVREQARQQFQQMLSRLVDAAHTAGQWVDGIGWARLLLALEPWDEAAHRQLMRLLAANGQRSAALAQFRVCADLLAEELGVEPEAETVALAAAIRSGEQGSGGAEESGSAVGLSEPMVRLPRAGARLVGREVELGQLQQMLAQPTCRLLTLVGMGGNGKTRLALAAAETQVGAFQDGVVFVSLVGTTAVSAPDAINTVATAIANALNHTFSAQRPLRESLLDYLRDKKLLLLLDNFEPLLPAAPLLLEMLQAAPNLKLLVTSRERLNVVAAWVFDVAGLPFATAKAAEPMAYPAPLFFAERAQQVRPDFDLGVEETAVNRICQLVHGSPLALELAANWVRLLNCGDIAAQLEQDLDLLQSRTSDHPPRQQSMAAVLAASWALLDSTEQQAMRRLAVFHDGWSLAGAQEVAGVGLPLLARLMDKSLLEVAKNGRYRLHELVRQYGLEQLHQDPGEVAAVQQRYANYYTHFLQERQPRLADKLAVAELDAEVENLKAAWQWLVGAEKRPWLPPFLAALWAYYRRKGWYQEAVGILGQACQLPDWPPLQQAQWRRWLGEAFYQLGDLRESGQQVEQGLLLLKRPLPQGKSGWLGLAASQMATQLRHRLRPPRPTATMPTELDLRHETLHALRLLAQLAYFTKQRERGAVLNLYGLNLAEQLGLPAETGMGYGGMTVLFRNLAQHKLADRYRALAEQLLPDMATSAEKAAVLQLVGYDGMSVGQWSLAKQTLTEAASLFTRLEMGRSWAECWTLLGFLHMLRGRFDQGARQYAEAGVVASERGDLFFRFVGLTGQAAGLLRLGDSYLPDVAGLLEQAQAMPNLPLTAEDKVWLYGLLGRVQLRLGNLVEAEAWAHETLAAMAQSTFMYFYSMDGYTAPAEIFLALTATTPYQPQRGQMVQQALQRQQAFARVYPVGQPGAWLTAGRWAWENGRFPQAHQLWQQSLTAAQKLGMAYDTARAHWVIGHYLPSETGERAAHLQQAEQLFERLGVAAPA